MDLVAALAPPLVVAVAFVAILRAALRYADGAEAKQDASEEQPSPTDEPGAP